MGALQIINEAIKSGKAATSGLKAADRAAAGKAAAELIKAQEQIKASEALGQLMEKGFKRTTTTQADRTRVGGGNIGGAAFPAISQADPNYAGRVWGVMDEGTATRLKNLTDPETAWTTMLGSANQLKSNPIVFDKLKRGFIDAMKQGKLSEELQAKINHNLELTFGEGADIRDPSIWKQADTFEKRAALANLMMGQGIAPSKGGVALGGEKSGKGVIFKPTETLIRETEPTLLHPEHGGEAPTFSAGPRLFRLDPTSEFRPDLHPGFPTMIHGEDLGMNVKPTPTEVYLPEWHKKFKKDNPERKAPGYYDLALGVEGEGLPSQELHDEYIRHLLREGFAEGGEVGADHPDAKLKEMIDARLANAEGMAEGGEVSDADSKLKAMIDARFSQHIADGGEAHFAAGGSSRRKADVTEALTEGLAPMLYGGAKGALASLLGFPGELEQLGRTGINFSFGSGDGHRGIDVAEEPFLPNTKRVSGALPNWRGSKVANQVAEMGTDLGENIVGTMLDPIAALKGAKPILNAAKMLTGSRGTPSAAQAQRGVIKMPGGNWLKGLHTTPGNVEQGIQRLRPFQSQESLIEHAKSGVASRQAKGEDPAYFQGMLEEAYRRNALNKWVEGNLQNYVKKQMGTPEDPVRALHEQGITHLPKDLLDETDYLPERDLRIRRGEAGFPKEGMGQSELAKKWENLADENIWSTKAGKLQAVPEQTKLAEDARAKLDTMATNIKFRFNQEVLNKLGSKLTVQERSKLAEMPVHKKAEILGNTEYDDLAREYQDLAIKTNRTDTELAKANPWVGKVDPNADLYSGVPSGLGFDHIIDILKQDVEAGRIRPEQLNKVSMEQAVRRAHEYDQEMAKKMAEAQIKATEGMPVHKEYPEGYKWIELTAPKDNPKRLSEIDTLLNANRQGGEYGVDWLRRANGEKEYFVTKGSGRNTVYMDKFPTEEEAIARGKELSGQQIDVDALRAEREGLTKEVREKKLEDALKYEGDTMGHCVGGYCPDVLEGRSRIYSLRDAKGEPHVTVEVKPNQHLDYNDWYNQQPTSYKALLNAKKSEPGYSRYQEPAYLAAREALPPRIVQIKGKQNAAPKEDYLPFVQDFVKSGKYSDVGDLHNTGLVRIYPESDLAVSLAQKGLDVPSYATQKEIIDLLKQSQVGSYRDSASGTTFRAEPPIQGMKRGGPVNIEQEYKFKKFRK